jgi:leader peptidase (prepilin peptidase) / N-methyltransferase
MEVIVVVLLGLIIGSFLNVVISRLPEHLSIVKPRSRCPRCLAPIPFYHNLPILSFIVLRGRCRACRARISLQYPLVELLSAFSFWISFQTFGLSVHAAFTALFLTLLIVLAVIDLTHMILPDELTLGGAVVFLGYSFFNPVITPWDSFLSAFGTSLVFLALYVFYLKVRKLEGLGQGDIKMMLLLGAFLGFQQTVVALLLASCSGLAVGLFFIIFRKKTLKLALPFGTFLSLGAYIALFWGNDILLFLRTLLVRI